MNPTLRTFVFALFAVLLVQANAYAQFDVSVHFNGGSDVVYIGEDNILEVYITNSSPVEGMTVGFEFSNSAGSFELVSPYGTRPPAPNASFIMEHGDAIDKFAGIGHLLVVTNRLPDSILFGGADASAGTATDLPVHMTPTLCYSMKIRIPAGLTPTESAFCVNNIFYPPAGTWLMVSQDGSGTPYSQVPTFQGQSNSSDMVPDAPSVYFDLVQRPPCDPLQLTNCPTVLKGDSVTPIVWDFDVTPDDVEPVTWTVQALDAVINTPSIDADGNFSFLLSASEAGSFKPFRVIAENECGLDTCDFDVEYIIGDQPFVVQIEKTHSTLQGNYEYVSITMQHSSYSIGGFDFLVGYDASALIFNTAQLGEDLGPAGCGWEYFTFRYGAQGNCGGVCPSGLLRVVAIADANNAAKHPDCFNVAPGGELVRLKFYVTNDRLYECQYIPIQFAWMDCGDNGISNVGGDTLWISSKVFAFENTDPLNDPRFEITDSSCHFAISYGGACVDCNVSAKYAPVRHVIFWNGGIDIVCADSIDAPGDLNLNGIGYEIADAVLYTNYFLKGLSALNPNPQTREAQIAASDANQDGTTLTVGDLVYLLRVVVGDALPYSKLAPFANSAVVSMSDGLITTESSVEIGAMVATFRVSGDYVINSTSEMNVISAEENGVVRVLVYSGLEDMSKRLSAGRNEIFSISGDVELLSTEVSDYNGNMLTTALSKSVLPSEFKLLQNSPNPFNPVTKIGLDLPVVSDWTLEIFNVAGQLVTSYSGRNQGHTDIEWNAANQPSGVYFYKVRAADWTESRKMLLLK